LSISNVTQKFLLIVVENLQFGGMPRVNLIPVTPIMTKLLNNRYQTIQLLGAGGFGETSLAEDTYLPSSRRCVIKQLKPVANNPQVQQQVQYERFQREAAILEKLGEGSDQIPKLYAYFSENGQFYLVQEWIQGPTLTSKVEAEGPLSEAAVRDILVSLLLVLDYIHSEGIIHRDIKPDNIILRQLNGKPVLIDFGAVKETMAAVVNAQGKNNHSIVVGTPGFMSPEQASGRPIYASDLYSLGLTAIYMLTGKLSSELEIDPQTGEILWQQHVLNISPTLATVLEKAIQYHPRERYTTAMKMLDALQSSIPSPPPQPATQATVILSPAAGKASQHAIAASPHTAPVISQPSSQGNRQKALILGSLIAGSLVGAAAFFGFVHNQSPQSLIAKPPLPQSSPVPPVAKSTPTSEPVFEPANTSPAPVKTQAPSPSVVSVPQLDNQPQKTEVPSPSVDKAPPPDNQYQNFLPDNAAKDHIPGFLVGTPESVVAAALGKPTKSSRGLWNTRAISYNDFVPNQIDLGYLYNPNSGLIRETEAAFAQSVDLQVMLTTLDRMSGGRASEEIKRGLQRVQQRHSDHYSFTKGSLKGMIVRQNCDFIYISIWDADLHDFDVAGSRRC